MNCFCRWERCRKPVFMFKWCHLPKKARSRTGSTPAGGKTVKWIIPLDEANGEEFDALVLPGGVMNPDHLRRDPQVLQFVKSFFTAGKPVGAICHGPWTLIDAGVVRGRKMTSYETIQTDLKNAGAQWVDEEVVVDNGLVTSRKPDDLPAFNAKLIEEIAEGVHQRQAMAA